MKNALRERDRAVLAERLRELEPGDRARWGRMDAASMLAHLHDSFEVLSGRREADFPQAAPRFLRTALGRFLLIDAPLPWPKGKVQAPAAFHTTEPGDFAADRERVIAGLEDFAAHPERCTRPHPVFGHMPVRQWGRVVWRHLDHHLRQFGH